MAVKPIYTLTSRVNLITYSSWETSKRKIEGDMEMIDTKSIIYFLVLTNSINLDTN